MISKSRRQICLLLTAIILLIQFTACAGATPPPGQTPVPGATRSSLVTTLPNPPLSGVPPIGVPGGTGTTSAQSVTINLTAQNMAFDKTTISVPAGSLVTVNFDNRDNSIPHNFAVYKDSSAKDKIFAGEQITGPATVKYQFTAPTTPGNYFFRCDIHPTQMTGTFIVQ